MEARRQRDLTRINSMINFSVMPVCAVNRLKSHKRRTTFISRAQHLARLAAHALRPRL
ncbi:hypothetical protein CBM2623_A150070 [Cupriavidus taiwanensis]|nr:hypothetical protein CBM2608_A150070 [Cupriavidus taiwanensis]SPA25821.1 hypothetical protein CBM2623_A150070 [Cupriavidus taiwanensis]